MANADPGVVCRCVPVSRYPKQLRLYKTKLSKQGSGELHSFIRRHKGENQFEDTFLSAVWTMLEEGFLPPPAILSPHPRSCAAAETSAGHCASSSASRRAVGEAAFAARCVAGRAGVLHCPYACDLTQHPVIRAIASFLSRP